MLGFLQIWFREKESENPNRYWCIAAFLWVALLCFLGYVAAFLLWALLHFLGCITATFFVIYRVAGVVAFLVDLL